MSGVRAHVGGRAAAAAGEIGADAYATGNHVAFASEPSLFIAAHEAAHTVQQQGGVSLLGGVGQVGDIYEQHADAVADRVVRGESAEVLLDSMAGATSVPGAGVQRKAARGPMLPHERIGVAIDDGRRAVRQVRDEFIPAANVAYSARDFDAAGDAASSARFTMVRAENEAKTARRLLVDVVEDAYRSKLELEVNALDASIAAIKPAVGEVVRKAPPDRASSSPQPGFGTGPECGAETQDEASRQAFMWKGQLDMEDAELFANATPAPIPNDACAIDGPRAADAFSGIALYLQVKDALKAMKATQAYDEKQVGPGHAGPYELHANTRKGEILYYLARHTERGQVEWAIGPDSVDSFVSNADIYVGAARAALPGSKNVANSEKDGAERAEHIPSILELEAFGQTPYQQQEPADPIFELGRDSTSATPDLLGVEETNGGSAMVGARNTHLRLSEYTQEAARLARQLKAEVDAGKLDHMQARKEAVGGRNHLMQNVRGKMSPAARYASQKIKADKGVSVDFMAKKKTADILEASLDGGQGMEVFGEKGDVGKLRSTLGEESAVWERYRGALEAGENAQRIHAEALQELGEQPAVSRAVVNSAGKSNGMVTALAKGGRALGTAAAIYGVYDMVATIVDAEEGKRLHVAGGEMSSFAGGIVGGEAGAMAAVWLASLIPGVGTGTVIVVSLIGGMVGSAVGANMGPGINEIAGGVAHDGMEAVMGPGMPQNGGYGGMLDRSTKSGAKAFDIETRLADTLFAMDFSLEELEQKIEAARNEQEMQAYQKARLDLLDGRHELGTIYAALKSGAIDQGQVWDMMGERPDERDR